MGTQNPPPSKWGGGLAHFFGNPLRLVEMKWGHTRRVGRFGTALHQCNPPPPNPTLNFAQGGVSVKLRVDGLGVNGLHWCVVVFQNLHPPCV